MDWREFSVIASEKQLVMTSDDPWVSLLKTVPHFVIRIGDLDIVIPDPTPERMMSFFFLAEEREVPYVNVLFFVTQENILARGDSPVIWERLSGSTERMVCLFQWLMNQQDSLSELV
jgi:hypothetical protein